MQEKTIITLIFYLENNVIMARRKKKFYEISFFQTKVMIMIQTY